MTGWCGQPAFVHGGVPGPTVLAAAFSLSLTGALMVLFKVSHPPTGATTLIVPLGIIAEPQELIVIEAAVALLTAQAFVLNGWLVCLSLSGITKWRLQMIG